MQCHCHSSNLVYDVFIDHFDIFPDALAVKIVRLYYLDLLITKIRTTIAILMFLLVLLFFFSQLDQPTGLFALLHFELLNFLAIEVVVETEESGPFVLLGLLVFFLFLIFLLLLQFINTGMYFIEFVTLLFIFFFNINPVAEILLRLTEERHSDVMDGFLFS